MKENTYHRMTRRSPLRGLKLFKHKYLTKHRFYALLASLKLVREVKRDIDIPYNSYEDDYFNGVKIDAPIITERGRFHVSHIASVNIVVHHHWYESLKKHKVLYNVCNEEYYVVKVAVQAECESFLVKINPFSSYVVNRNNPRMVYIHKPVMPHLGNPNDMVKYNTITCDFLNARMKVGMENTVSDFKYCITAVNELLEITRRRLKEYIEGNPEEINEKLTGIKFDGEFRTKDGNRLIPNILCRKCGLPVFDTPTGYIAQCANHNCGYLHPNEVKKVDPKYYEMVYEQNKEVLHMLLND